MTQFIRLVVLYEDLRLELFGASVDQSLKPLETVNANYRELYFVRRSLSTILEIEQAIHKLNKCTAFKEFKKTWRESDTRAWDSAVEFFSSNHDTLKQRRGAYGGHYHDRAAEHVYEKLHSDHVGLIEERVDQADTRYARHVFKFALEFVGLALTVDKGSEKLEPFVEGVFQLMLKSFENATNAIRVIGNTWIFPRFQPQF